MLKIRKEKILGLTSEIIEALVGSHPKLATSNGILKTGGYLSVFNNVNCQLMFEERVGTLVPMAKWPAYSYNSEEKGTRLIMTRREHGHVTSHKSRSLKKERYGGAIVAGNYIFSFSGLPEDTDEAVMLALAVTLELMSLKEATKITEKNSNKVFTPLMNHLYA